MDSGGSSHESTLLTSTDYSRGRDGRRSGQVGFFSRRRGHLHPKRRSWEKPVFQNLFPGGNPFLPVR